MPNTPQPRQLPSPHAHPPTGRSQEPASSTLGGRTGCRTRTVPHTTVLPSALKRKRPFLPRGRPWTRARAGPGPRDAGLATRRPSRYADFSRPPRTAPRTPYNLCFKNTCRHGCASRVENVGRDGAVSAAAARDTLGKGRGGGLRV